MITKNKVVSIHYRLTDDSGEELDRSESNSPLVYLHGASQIIPGLESALEGLNKGDKKKVTVEASDAYGDADPALRMTVKRSVFPEDMQPEAGLQFAAEGNHGEEVVFTILEVADENVTIDGNHPLAGVRLHFDVEVADLREATKDELDHGHAHGADGHHHH